MRDKGKGKQSYLDSTKQGTDENGILSGLSSYPHDASLHSPETHRTELTSSSIDFGSEKLPDYPQLGSHLEAVMQGALETGGAACVQDTLPDSYTTVGEGTEDSNTAGCSEGSRCHAESSSSRSLPSAGPTVTKRADAGSSFASGSPSTSLTSAIDVLPPSPPPSVSAMSSSNVAPINTPNSPQHPSLPLVPGSSAISSHSTPIHNSPLLLHTGSGPGDIDDRNITTMMPGQILPFLNCPRCSHSALLEAPITLHCGHTVCSKHIGRPQNTSPPSSSLLSSILSSVTPSSSDAASSSGSPIPLCPLPTCTRRSPDDASPVYLHPAAHVGITSAPLPPSEHPPAPFSSRPAPPRVDVTVNKIIVLVQRAIQASTLVEEDRVPTLGGDEDERTDSEDDFEDEEGHDHDDEEDALFSRPPTHSLDDDSPSGSRRLLPHPRSPSSRSRRPRKRPRLSHTSPSTRAPSRRLDRAGDAGTSFEKELLTELTCEICFALMWQPVTTPCQHTFCSKCIQRSLDHSNACPLCREELPGYSFFQEHPCNKLVLSIILKAFPEPYAERGALIEAEERDSRLDTPIFVCQLSFPGMPMMLHLFEPRYRLMLRRCLATPNPCFGMIPPPRPSSDPGSPGNDYGTMLRIRNVQMFPDGRSIVETVGTCRFRIMERGMLDGYVVGRVERVDDFEEEVDEGGSETTVEDALAAPSAAASGSSLPLSRLISSTPRRTGNPQTPTNDELMTICRGFLDEIQAGTPWVVQHLHVNYVAQPTDPAQFSFWMALVLPIEEQEKAKLLPIRSPRLRLRLVVHWIEQLRGHWAYSYASASRWQVVYWWMCAMLIRILNPRMWRPTILYTAWAVVIAAILWAQVDLYRTDSQ